MKTFNTFIILILMLLNFSVCFSQSFNYDTSFVLLSSPDYDYRNPQFDKSQPSINYFIRDCIFSYEKWSSSTVSNIAVRFMKYNLLTEEIRITDDSFINRNTAVAYSTTQSSSENNKGALVFQSNRNGNWDIYFSEYNQTEWSSPVTVTSGIENETYPSIVSYRVNNNVNYLISYQKGNDIFVKNFFNGVWMNEINITPDDSLVCITPKLTTGPISQGSVYLAYLRKLNDSTGSISYHINQISASGDFILGTRKIIYQTGSQDNIRYSNGINEVILNYDYDTLGMTNFYSALTYSNFIFGSQTFYFRGSNFGGTGSSHGDITEIFIGGYSLYSWICRVNDSTQVIITNTTYPYDIRERRFYVGNSNAETFVNTSSKLVFGNKFRIRILWEKVINGRTAFIESFRDNNLTSVQFGSPVIPGSFYLSQNYPNSFNPVTKLEFGIPELGFVSLKVYNALGKEVAVLVNETKSPGSYSVEFDGTYHPSGIYFYTMNAGDFIETKRMILIK